jgi:O-antigen/teichoic acid export membrane protein
MKVSALLPSFLARRLAGRDTLRQSLDNASWLFLEQIVRMGLGLVVGVWLARYLGPEQYGWLSYAGAAVGVVTSLTSLGLNAVVVRELARDPAAASSWLGAAFFLKTLGAGAGFLICVGAAYLQPLPAAAVRPLIIIVALGMFFQTVDVIDLMFQAKGSARISGWVRLAACLLGNAVKVGLILAHASLPWLAAAGVLELAFSAAGWLWAAGRSGQRPGNLVLEWKRVGALLHESWPLALAGLAVYAQAYFDQLVIAQMLGGSELGQYAAAMRLVVAFSFIPTVVYTVASPEITRAKRDDEQLYHRRLFNLYRMMGALFLATAIPLMLAGTFLAEQLLGVAYAQAAALLPWLALRLFFTNFGVARSVFLTNEGLFRFGLLTAVAGAVVNVLLNLWLVPVYGARGAIASSMVSFAVTTFALEAFHPRARFNLRLMAAAVFLPWRPPSR